MITHAATFRASRGWDLMQNPTTIDQRERNSSRSGSVSVPANHPHALPGPFGTWSRQPPCSSAFAFLTRRRNCARIQLSGAHYR